MKTFLLLLFATIFLFGKNASAQSPQLIISEIMYNSPEDGADSLEFIEIYNNENTSVNLSGINFSQGVSYIFPDTLIAANTFFTIAKDSVIFQNTFGLPAFQWSTGSLSNNGEVIEIQNANGNTIDFVDFQNTLPWPPAANGLGASLVLCDLEADNNLAENWNAATTPLGIFINNQEIIANPNAVSNCPDGPIIKFLGSTISIIENNIIVDLKIAMNHGDQNLTTANISTGSISTAVINEDFSFDSGFPFEIIFNSNVEKDTQIVSIQILDDSEIEPIENIIFQLQNPTNGAIIDPMHDVFEITIEDNDATLPDLIISEIMYNPPETGMDSTEFIELFNNDTIQINLINYTFSQGVNFTFPEIILSPGEFIVVASDSIAFANYYGFTPLQWESGSLINSGEIIELRNPGGNLADLVEYDNTAEWSLSANGDGASLVLCDYENDNNVSTNWNASITSTGIIIDDKELFADPNMDNNCFIPLSIYPIHEVATMTSIDSNGVIDSLNKKCELKGIVHGVNLNQSNNGLQFVLIDENNNGITVYSNSETFGYDVIEGDEIVVQGTIAQFNGLAEIIPDTLWLFSQNNTLSIPPIVTNLDETTESQLVKIENLSIVNIEDWNNSDPSGFNVAVTNGLDTFDMRIDQDVDLFDMLAPNYNFHLTGLGGQYDQNLPYTENYQILPRYFQDLEMTTSIEFKEKNKLHIFPNPATNFIFIENNNQYHNLIISNIYGQKIFEKIDLGTNEKINVKSWESGFYIFTFYNTKKSTSLKIFMISNK